MIFYFSNGKSTTGESIVNMFDFLGNTEANHWIQFFNVIQGVGCSVINLGIYIYNGDGNEE